MRDTNKFEYPDERCKELAKKIKALVDETSLYADWLTNSRVRDKLANQLTRLIYKEGYPPEWDELIFEKVLKQVENFKEYSHTPILNYDSSYYENTSIAAEPYELYQWHEVNQETRSENETVLIGCFRDKKHLEWILSKNIYNIRLGKRKGSAEAQHDCFDKASKLYLYDVNHPEIVSIFNIVGNQEMRGKELKDMDYPRKKPSSIYWTFNLESVDNEFNPQINVASILQNLTNHKKGTPIFIEPNKDIYDN